ncbi:hypothetical protein JCM3770_005431 [Rhodotorula araucariae]
MAAPARSPLATLLHLVALCSLSWAFHQLALPGPMSDYMDSVPVGGRWQYLTILSLAASWLSFAAALVHDLVPLALFSRLKAILAILTVPVEGLVAVLYWSLTLYDPALLSPAVAPGESPLRIPLALDLALHALPALFLWTDFLAFSPPLPTRAHPALIAAAATAAYCAWMEHCAQGNGRYPYPMLDTMPAPARAAFYAAQVPVLVALFRVANAIHRAVRGTGAGSRSEAERVRRVENKVAKALGVDVRVE